MGYCKTDAEITQAIKTAITTTDVDKLKELSKEPALGIRRAVVENPHTPNKILFKMLLKGEKVVAQDMLNNPNANKFVRSVAEGLAKK